jgi:heat-inducible transcriptional repressor
LTYFFGADKFNGKLGVIYMQPELLTEREIEIFDDVIKHFILTGNPVGSRTLSRKNKQKLRPASIRKVMSDLEQKGFLGHPHTSAGRVPTTKGYRYYVNTIMKFIQLSQKEKELIKEYIGQFTGDINYILDRTSSVLAKISRQLGVILTPKFEDSTLEKVDIVQVASDKLLVILSLKSAIVKTILLEVRREVSRDLLVKIIQILNERLSGSGIKELRRTFHHRVKDLVNEKTGIIRLFVDSADRLFDFTHYVDIKYTGTSNILSKPEFKDVSKFSTLIELFEEKNIIIHMMEQRNNPPQLRVTIGDENQERLIQECSIITAPYKVSNIDGILGVIGPIRMEYNNIIPLVDYTAKFVTEIFNEK